MLADFQINISVPLRKTCQRSARLFFFACFLDSFVFSDVTVERWKLKKLTLLYYTQSYKNWIKQEGFK